MKRDMDLVRKILFAIEASEEPIAEIPCGDSFGDMHTLYYHVTLLSDAGLIGELVSMSPEGASVSGLTWPGHDFLDAARNDTNWNKAKEVTAKAGGWTFDLLKQTLVEIISQTVSKSLGMPS